MPEVSAIDRDVFQHQLVGVAEEMSTALRRSAYSPVIWDVYDYACAIFTPGGELIAQAVTIPAQLGTMSTALAHIRRAIPTETWAEGDALVCNDPYKGCTHTPDITVFTPVIHDGTLIAIASTIAHHTDIGGRFPMTTSIDNAEVFGEGLIFPQIRLCEGGVWNETAVAFIRANVRDPEACLGDLRAQLSGCRIAEARLGDIAARRGNAAFRALSDDLLDYGERFARGVVAGWPDGVYRAEVVMENGIDRPDDIVVRLAATVAGDTLHLDFSGSSPQVGCALNCPWSSTVSLATYAVKCLTGPQVPHNEGFNRAMTIAAPLGSVLNPRRPAAVGSRVFAQQATADAVLQALGGLAPEHGAAGAHISFPVFRASGVDDRVAPDADGTPRTYRILDMLGGGMGGFENGDGGDVVDTHGSNCALMSAEIMETVAPVRVRATRLAEGSGGAGRWRGGLGIVRDYEILAETALSATQVQQSRAGNAPWGLHGGGRGAPASATLNPGTDREVLLPPRGRHRTLRRGDVVRVRSAGGGGWGDPAQRSADAIRRDAEESYT